MSLISRMRKGDAVYWPPASFNDFGRAVVGAPVAIKCRWEDKVEKFTDAQGDDAMSKAMIYVSQVCQLGGYLFQGLLADAPADPTVAKDCFIIRKFDNLPNLRYTERLLTVWV